MFWGLIMEPQRRYTQQVKKAFHISMAALDYSTSLDEPTQVMCGFEGRNYLLCTLRKPDIMQCALDLNFDVGSELSFATNGNSHVHLTGFLTDEFPSELAEEEEEDEVELQPKEKRKNIKKREKKSQNGPPSKKAKSSDEAISESDSDVSDVNLKDLLEESFSDSENDETFAVEEENEAEEEEEDEEGDEEEADEEEGEDEEDEEVDDVEEHSSLSEAESEEPNQQPEKTLKKKKAQVNGMPVKESPKPKKNKKAKEELKGGKTPKKENQQPKKKVLQGGIIIEDLKDGEGQPAKSGKFVNVYYEGRLKQNNKLFDSTNKGAGFSFRLGGAEVIKGWDIGIVGMKVGGKRRIIIPPAMGYGIKGSPPAIPGNSTLVFEVELKKIR